MDEKELKTSPKQRIFIILIAIIMVGSIIASYAAIVINGSKGAADSTEAGQIDDSKVAEYEAAYNEKLEEFKKASKSDYDEFIGFKSELKAFNEASANEAGVEVKDLKEGTGSEDEGVKGMKLGGIRRITMPGEMAYGDSMEICGGYNKPLRFMVMAIPKEEPMKSMAAELDDAYMRVQYAQYGVDYDSIKQNTE